MGKTLFIAEKPKVATELLKSPRFRNAVKHTGSKPYFGYYENEKYIISWCLGHLLELKNPEEMDDKYKEFKFEHLPIILTPEYKTKKENEEQIKILTNLLNRPDVDVAVNACDRDKEGELIYREVYEFAGIDKKQYRLFISSYEPAELEAALNKLLPGENFDSLAAAAKARQYLDYIVGVNVTRGSTSKLASNQFLLSTGRVQMCLLHEILKRELEIANYKEQTFYNLKVITESGLTAVRKSEDQLLDSQPLIQLGNRVKDTHLLVREFKENDRKKKPKLLYNLTDLYKDAYAKLKISAEVAKKHIQNLYEEGYLSYPRSSSRHLPTEQVGKVKEIFDALNETTYKELVSLVDVSSISNKHATFNDELVNSHYAIIPTKKMYIAKGRHTIEQQLYSLIVQRFIGNFMPPAVYHVREVLFIDQEGNEYVAKEKVLKQKGFLTVFNEGIEEGSNDTFSIPVFRENDQLLIINHELVESTTKKPALHSESSMLTFMETAGRKLDDEHLKELMKGKRIGTVATEETFIPKLEQRGYISITKGQITTTNVGRAFIESFPIEDLKNPSYTAEMEGMITQIEGKELSYDEFIAKTNAFIHSVVEGLGKIDNSVSHKMVQIRNAQVEIAICLCKKGKIIDKGNFYGCSSYPECEISLPKKIKEKSIPGTQVQKLFETGKTDLMQGFKSEKNEFAAYLVISEGAIKFSLPTQEELSLGTCPKCRKGDILNRNNFFGCSEYKNGCTFNIPAKIKEKKIPVSQVKKLVNDGHTDFLPGFKSEKGEFIAAIRFNGEKLEFILPTQEDLSLGVCPKCRKGNILTKGSFYGCSEYRNGCTFNIPAKIKEKKIPVSQVKKLISNSHTDFISGFKSEKGEFTAAIRFNGEKIEFVFPTVDDRTIGKCPLCNSRVIIGKTTYLCENYRKSCDFMIPGMFCGKSITKNLIKKILEKNITDEIDGFKSSKSGKEFTARLSYNTQEKRLTFVFDNNTKKK